MLLGLHDHDVAGPQKNRVLARVILALAGAVLASLTVVSTAAGRQDDADLLVQQPEGTVIGCPLERIGDQFVQCGNLTGNDVPAPSYVPEQS